MATQNFHKKTALREIVYWVRIVRTFARIVRGPVYPGYFPEYPGNLCPTTTFQCEEYIYPSYPFTHSLSLSLLLILNLTRSKP